MCFSGNWSVKEIFISVCFLTGIPIESNLDHQHTLHYTYNYQQLLTRTQRMTKDLDPQNEATLLEVQTEKNNILISTGKEKYSSVMLIFIRLGCFFNNCWVSVKLQVSMRNIVSDSVRTFESKVESHWVRQPPGFRGQCLTLNSFEYSFFWEISNVFI